MMMMMIQSTILMTASLVALASMLQNMLVEMQLLIVLSIHLDEKEVR